MIYLNCAINPVLYNLMSGRFRNAFKRLLRGETGSKGGGTSNYHYTSLFINHLAAETCA